MLAIGLARTIYIYGAFTVFLAGNMRSYTVCIYGSGQPQLASMGVNHPAAHFPVQLFMGDFEILASCRTGRVSRVTLWPANFHSISGNVCFMSQF